MAKISPTGSNNRHRQAGMTLIEVLVVLVIMTLIISSISYIAFRKTASVKDLTMQIAQNLRLSRQQAIRLGQPQRIVIDLAQNTFEFPETIIQLPEQVSITVKTAEQQLINQESVGMLFYPDASSSGGQILLESAKQSFKILVVWISGKVSVQPVVQSQ